jgi:hypothetical protein
VVDGHAYMFYFGSIPPKENPRTGSFTRRRGYAVYVVELQQDENGRVFCDTTAPCRPRLR